MLTKQDCVLLLGTLENVDEETKKNLSLKAIKSPSINVEVLKFINDNRPFEVSQFYDNLRKNYNHKKSKLYGNIVKEIDDPQEVLTTLSALLTQILLFSKKCSSRELFLKHSRAAEISNVLNHYFIDYDITSSIVLLRLIKADLKAFESIR